MKLSFFFSLLFLNVISCHARWQQMTPDEITPPIVTDTIVSPQVDSTEMYSAHFHLPYQMDQPQERFVLPENLKEISGLSMSPSNKDLLIAIQDEEGILFYINKNTGVVEQEIAFYKNGDYEGVEVVGDTTYVVKSTGTIYAIANLQESPPYVRKHKFFLTKENDVEGICYDAKENRLLVACKGPSVLEKQSGETDRFQKAIYSFHLDQGKMDLEPTYVFTLADIQEYLKDRVTLAHHGKLCSYFTPNVESLIFSPSAIAIHPITGNLYMTSSAKKILMVFNKEGKILHLEKMDKNVHPQPEGLSFDVDGTMYMANEGKNGEGTILKFSYQPELAEH